MTERKTLALLSLLLIAVTAEAAAPPAVRLDAYGDPLPFGAVARLGTSRWSHGGWSAFGFTRSGDQLVSLGPDAVRFWDTKTGKVVRWFPADCDFGYEGLSMPVAGDVIVTGKVHRLVGYEASSGKELWQLLAAGDKFWRVAMTADGSAVAVGTYAGVVTVYEAKTGQRLRALAAGKHAVSRLEFSADGRTLLSAEEARTNDPPSDVPPKVRVWDVASGRRLCEWAVELPVKVALSPNGRTVAFVSSLTHFYLDVATGRILPRLKDAPESSSSDNTPETALFAPDGKHVVCYWDRFEVWDAKSMKRIRDIRARAGRPVFRRDGRVIATHTGWEFSLIDPETGKNVTGFPDAAGDAAAVTVSGDGRLVAVVNGHGETFIHDAATGKPFGRRPPRSVSHPHHIGFVRGDTSLAGVEQRAFAGPGGERKFDAVLWCWDYVRGREALPDVSLGEEGGTCAFDPRGASIAHLTTTGIAVRDLPAGKLRRALSFQLDREGKAERVSRLFFAPDGNSLAVSRELGYSDKAIDLRDVKLDRILGSTPLDEADQRDIVGFAGHGRYVLGLLDLGTKARKWNLLEKDADDLNLPATVRRDHNASYYVSPNGLWLVRSQDPAVTIIEVATGRVVLSLRGGHPFSYGSLSQPCAWTPDGRRLVVGSRPPLVFDLPSCASAPKSDRPAAIWADLAGNDAAAAFRAVCWLSTHPEEAVPLLANHLSPAPAADPASIRRHLAALDADDFALRESAEAELKKIGRQAKPLLEKAAAESASAEQRVRARRLLDAMKPPAWPRGDVALLRAIQALAWADSPRARKQLEALAAGDPDAAVTRYARAELDLRR